MLTQTVNPGIKGSFGFPSISIDSINAQFISKVNNQINVSTQWLLCDTIHMLYYFLIIDKTNEVGCDVTRHSNCHAKYSFSLNMLVLVNYFHPNNSIGLLSFWKKIKLIFLRKLLSFLCLEKKIT